MRTIIFDCKVGLVIRQYQNDSTWNGYGQLHNMRVTIAVWMISSEYVFPSRMFGTNCESGRISLTSICIEDFHSYIQ